MSLLKPAALRPGDRVAVVAPASPFPRDEFEAGVAELRRLGFEPVWDESVFARDAYLAGDAAVRARAFLAAWTDPQVKALVAARGGYGSVHLLPGLPIDALRATPKLLIGYSDVTAMLSYLTTHAGICAVHGPTVAGRLSRGAEGYDRETFLAAVGMRPPVGEIGDGQLEILRPGEVRGPLYGGNLTQLAATLGTPYAFRPEPGCILFLEDVNERPYRIDRMLTQLDQAGILPLAAGLVFGVMPGCDEADRSLVARDAVVRRLAGFAGPVVWGLPSGHTPGPALTLPLGVGAVLSAGSRAVLRIDEAAVS